MSRVRGDRALSAPGVRGARGRGHVVHPAGEQPGHDHVQVRVAGDQPRGQVRYHPVAPLRQPLGQVPPWTSRRRGGDAVAVTVMPGGTQSAIGLLTDPVGPRTRLASSAAALVSPPRTASLGRNFWGSRALACGVSGAAAAAACLRDQTLVFPGNTNV